MKALNLNTFSFEQRFPADEINENFQELQDSVNNVESEQLKNIGGVFDCGSLQFDNAQPPISAWDTTDDPNMLITKGYLRTAGLDIESGIHTHDNKALLDTITEDKTEIVSAFTTGATAMKLVDTNQQFVTDDDVRAGMIVHNTTDDTYAIVTAVDSESTLSLDTNIMASAENYKIYPAPSVNAGGGTSWNSYMVATKIKEALDETLGQKYSTIGKGDRVALLSDTGVGSGISQAHVGYGIAGIGVPVLFPSGTKIMKLDFSVLHSSTSNCGSGSMLIDITSVNQYWWQIMWNNDGSAKAVNQASATFTPGVPVDAVFTTGVLLSALVDAAKTQVTFSLTGLVSGVIGYQMFQ